MTVYLAADHRGLKLKNSIRDWLAQQGYSVEDLGAMKMEKDDDYPDFGIALGKKVSENRGSLGLAFCGSGAGISMAAGKVKGIRAAMACQPRAAEMVRKHDDANVISIGADFVDEEKARKIVAAALETKFSGAERHVRRINKVKAYESSHEAA